MNTLKNNPFELIYIQHTPEERFTRTISAWEVPNGVFIRVTATLRDQFTESVSFAPGLKKSDILPHEEPTPETTEKDSVEESSKTTRATTKRASRKKSDSKLSGSK